MTSGLFESHLVGGGATIPANARAFRLSAGKQALKKRTKQNSFQHFHFW
jgi:hypothetical protein